MEDGRGPILTRRAWLGATTGTLALLACDGDPSDPDAGGFDAGGGTDAGGGVDAGADAGSVDAGRPDTGPIPDGGGCADVSFDIGDPHPAGFRHNLVIEVADIEAGVDKTYDIQGESPHPHTLVVTSEHFSILAAGGEVTIDSSIDMGLELHDHPVTIRCGP